ncbi:MAG: hypothetical protein ACM3TR_07375 [Caulobacteraceae bacterium]
MKTKIILIVLALLTALPIGCTKPAPPAAPSPTPTQAASPTPTQTSPPETTPNVVTSASIVDTEAGFEKAISSTGTWIIATVKDLTFNKDLVLDGEFKNGKKDSAGKDIIQRKIALYTQDDKRNVTGRFTLTAPKLTINSPNAGLWYGTFKGDIYVNAPNFTLYGATVDGNIYFASDAVKNTFKIDQTKGPSKVTGKQEVKK